MKHAITPNDVRSAAKRQIVSDFHALTSDAENLLKSTATYSDASLSAARSKFQDTLDEFKSRVAGAQEAGIDALKGTAAATEDYVKSNPWRVIGAAVMVGLLVGFFSHRR